MNASDALGHLTEAELTALWDRLGVVDANAETVGVTLVPTTIDPWSDSEGLPRLLGAGADFDLGAPLARGGMAVVHEATQRSLGREVAIKRLRPDRRSDRMRHQLLREARVAGELEHPHVIPVHGVGVDGDGEPALVMKRVAGISWRAFMRRPDTRVPGDTPLDRNLEILRAVARALHFAHRRGVVHRDLKPENVMVGDFGEIYLLDWGIALRLGPDGAAPTDTVAGTPGYMAPEMAAATGVTARSDVYLLGAVLHELLTGAPPHEGGTLYGAMVAAYRSREPRYTPETPAELAAIAWRAMARDPADRFASADDFRLAVMAFLRHRESHVVASEAEARLGALLATAPDDETTAWRYFGAARFGFEQALRVWPENGNAEAGRERAIHEMARREARAGRPETATSLLAELPEPDPAVAAEVEAARARASAADAELAALRELEHELDPAVGARSRVRVALGLAVVLGLGAIGFGWLARRFAPAGPEPIHYLPHAFGLCALGAGTLLWQRRGVFQNRINRRFATLAMLGFGGGLFFRLLLALSGAPFLAYLPLEWGLYATVLGMMGFLERRRLSWSGLPLAVGAVGMLLWPRAVYEIAGLSMFLGLALLGWFWRE